MRRKRTFIVATIRDYKNDKGKRTYTCRCFGFYPTLKSARKLITKNWELLSEAGWYKYAVIGEFNFGWYPYERKSSEEWYLFKKKGVARIDKPKRWNRR